MASKPTYQEKTGEIPTALLELEKYLKTLKGKTPEDYYLIQAYAIDYQGTESIISDFCLSVQRCDCCSRTCFAKNVEKTYGGMQYACKSCIAAWYVYCRECDSLKLKSDTEGH